MTNRSRATRAAGGLLIKRVYEEPHASDGVRVLIDRVWPRGLSKAKAAVNHWMKDLAPSTALRQWFAHDPAKWNEFRQRYHAELDREDQSVAQLRDMMRGRRVTLVYGARDTEHNNAVALQEYLQRR